MTRASTPAGLLTYADVGAKVAVTYQSGNITSTVRDVIERVSHTKAGVRIFFVRTAFRPGVIGMFTPEDQGLLVSPELDVEYLDE